jgi:TusA-related sulfurtransferase
MNPAETADRTLDATGLSCPEPVFRTRRMLAEMEPGQLLRVSADDPLAEVDMAVFCQRTGHSMVSSAKSDDCWIFLLRKTGVQERTPDRD